MKKIKVLFDDLAFICKRIKKKRPDIPRFDQLNFDIQGIE
jgi:hypothetical protein